MNILIDALLVGIMALCCIAGYKNGFVKTVISFFKNIVALVAAALYSAKLGHFFYEKFFKNVFENIALDKIANWLGADSTKSLDIGPLLEAEHSEFFKYVENLGVDITALAEKYNEFGANAGEAVAEYISQPLGMAVSKVVAFIAIFIVTVFVINIAGFIIGKIVKLPVLNATNKLLGLILGIVLGVIFVFIFVSILDVILPYVKVGGESLGTGDFKGETIIYGYLSSNSPMGLLEDLILK